MGKLFRFLDYFIRTHQQGLTAIGVCIILGALVVAWAWNPKIGLIVVLTIVAVVVIFLAVSAVKKEYKNFMAEEAARIDTVKQRITK